MRWNPREPAIKVLFCASEATPFAKTGGLADVAGSLPLALGELGAQIVLVVPKYRGVLFRKKRLSEKVRVLFIENEEFFNRHSLYGNPRGDYEDNLRRFSFFCHRALDVAKEIGFRPDIVHANDWQTALLPVILKSKLTQDPFFKKTRTVLTIHNLAYQGHFPSRQYPDLGLDQSLFSINGFEFYGKINVLKAGILYADRINTVSPTYAEEMKTRQFGFGLEGVIRSRQNKLSGILNGLDTRMWDPASDKRIKKTFSIRNLEGKRLCKQDLQTRCRFEKDPEIPVFAMVTRLAEQKGLDILSEVCDEFLSRRVQFAMLGDGDSVYRTTFRNVGARHPKNAAVFLSFNTAQAHGFYAGADFFLMPSYFEPCGLGQMISMRYGAIPVVRRTGGLADTVVDAEDDATKANGIVFRQPSAPKLMRAIERAIQIFKDRRRLATLKKNAMRANFSWDRSAVEYLKLYKDALDS